MLLICGAVFTDNVQFRRPQYIIYAHPRVPTAWSETWAGKAKSTGSSKPLPITPTILRRLRSELDKEPSKWDNIMLWAACCTCFFGFLRSGEVTIPSQKDYDSSARLSYGDVMFDSRHNPTLVQVNIKASKTDPFRKGVAVCIGRTNNDLCPVAALAAYIIIRGSSEGPFFLLENQIPLTRDRFVKITRDKLSATGMDASHYSGHSFRIGAATTASAYGVEIPWYKHWVAGKVQPTCCTYGFLERN